MKYSIFFIAVYAALVFNFSFLYALPQADASAPVASTTASTSTNVITPVLSKDTKLGIKLLSALSHDKNVAISPITMWASLYAFYERLAPDANHAELVNKLKTLLSFTTDQADPSKIINLEDLDLIVSGIKQRGRLSAIFESVTENELPTQSQISEVFRPYLGTGSYFHYRPDYNTINDWVDKNTMGTIREFIKYGTIPDYLAVQAFSVQGQLSTSLLQEPTATIKFSDGAQSTPLPALNLIGDHISLQTNTFDAVTIPYSHGLYSATIIKPKGTQTLTGEDLSNALLQLSTQKQKKQVQIQIPTFETHTIRKFTTADLNMSLSHIPSYFSAGTKTPSTFGGFHHQVRLRLLESDIQSASAPAPNPKPAVIVFDRPFYYFITKQGGPNDAYMSTHCAAYIRKVNQRLVPENVGTERVEMLSKTEMPSQNLFSDFQFTNELNTADSLTTQPFSVTDFSEIDFFNFDSSESELFKSSSFDLFPDQSSGISSTPSQTNQQPVQQVQTPSGPFVDPF